MASAPLRVLIVEDSLDDALLIQREFKRGGYEPLFVRVETAEAMRAELSSRQWDVVISDYSLPHFSAPEALSLLQELELEIPFIIASGTIGEAAAVTALKAGADDFIVKHNLARFIPAVERELREAAERRRRRTVEIESLRKTTFVKLLQEIAVAANEATTINEALQFALDRVCAETGWPVGHIFVLDDKNGDMVSSMVWHLENAEQFEAFRNITDTTIPIPSHSVVQQVVESGKPIWIKDLHGDSAGLGRANIAKEAGLQSGCLFPLLLGKQVIGVLEFFSTETLGTDDLLSEVIMNIAGQLGRVIEREQAEKTLLQSEQRFRVITEGNLAGVYIIQHDKIRYANPAMLKVFGYEAEDLVDRMTVTDLIHPDDRVHVLEQIQERSTNEKQEVHYTFRGLHRSGSILYCEVFERPADYEGQQAIIGTLLDITERKRAEKELSSLYDATSVLFKSDNLVDLGRQIAQAVVKEFQQVDCGLILVEKNHNELNRLARSGEYRVDTQRPLYLDGNGLVPEAIRTGKVIYAPDVTTDSRYISSESRTQSELVIPLQTSNGILGVLDLQSVEREAFTAGDQRILMAFAERAAAAIEIVQLYEKLNQYAAELEWRVAKRTAELYQAKERVEAILNNNSDGIVLADATLAIQQSNPSFSQMLGYQTDEIFKMSIFGLVTGDYLDPLTTLLERVVVSQQQARIEVVCRHKDDHLFDADLALAPIVQDGITSGIICSFRDMTERKQIEEELRAALEKAKEVNELKSRFTSMVSHEFRTPLATILSTSDTLKMYGDRLTQEKKAERLDRIQSQVRHLVSMLNDVLTLNRAEYVGMDFNPAPIDLEAFALQLVEEIQISTSMHTIEATIKGDCKGAILDERLVRQVITNLLSNAVKYSPKGGTVRFDMACGNGEVVLQIQDSGIGIPEDDQKHLFEAFHRSRNVGNISGTGLGLSIVKRSIEAHNGTVTVSSEVGKGTTFTIRFPMWPGANEKKQ